MILIYIPGKGLSSDPADWIERTWPTWRRERALGEKPACLNNAVEEEGRPQKCCAVSCACAHCQLPIALHPHHYLFSPVTRLCHSRKN